MAGQYSGDESDSKIPDAINYTIPPSTILNDHDELRTHRSILWNGLTGMLENIYYQLVLKFNFSM